MSDHRCNGHETRSTQLIYVELDLKQNIYFQ